MKRKHGFGLALLVNALLLAGNHLLFAQSAAQTLLQQTNLRNATPPPESAANSDSDLGDIEAVQRYPKPDMFSFTTQQQYFYTDNVFYTHKNAQGASGYLGSYIGSFVPYSLRDWTPRVTLQFNMVRYGGVSQADFDNENAMFSSQYVFGGDRSWTWTPSVTLSRFTAATNVSDHEFYKEYFYDNQVAHTQKLGSLPLFLVTAYDIGYHQASPKVYNRLDNTLTFSLKWYPVQDVSMELYARPSYRIYYTDTPNQNQGNTFRYIDDFNFIETTNAAHIPGQNDRDDFNITSGLDVTWTPIKYLSVSADFSASNDYSNNSGLSYNQLSPSVSLTGSYKF